MSAPVVLPFPEPPSAHMLVPTQVQPTTSNSLDSIIAQSIVPPPPTIQTMGGSAGAKESQPMPKLRPVESAPLVEIHEEELLPVEVEGYLQKLEQAGEIKLDQPITHDGDVLLANSEAQVVKERIVLPMTQTAAVQSKKSPITDSTRWLAEWCMRLIKMMKDGVKYADNG